MGRVLRKILRPVTTRIDHRAEKAAERAVQGRATAAFEGAVDELRLRNARGLDELYDALTEVRAELAAARAEIEGLRGGAG
ncbi:hypothetical protein [Phytomonospora endophytica]|uniref:Uncharacterized protein n=1 Tax=Phytomonospora endophytica TaxID=714109 RepID=A0A841FZM6_9ACTN|nr:hypothetical protein [Phytomonospora endophytica]MBB6039158.1 hypothetical protein [Phytomonospora endophytica]GIG67605.1 hypothetical protein Pen01_39000 [Phytomonospora endophytica]